MANTIKTKAGVTLSYIVEKQTISTVVFSDGKQLIMVGSTANAAVKKAYDEKVAEEVPPVVVEPTPPVIIIPPSPGSPREITLKEFGQLKDVQGESFKVKPCVAPDQYWLTGLKKVSIDLSQVQFTTKNMPSMELKGVCEDLVLYKPNFKDTSGSGVSYRGDDVPFGTVIKGLQILGSVSENSGAIFSGGGGINEKGFSISFQGLTIKDFLFKNSPAVGTIVYCQSLEDFEISNGIIDNVNGNSDIHNGLLMLAGNGKLHDIKCTNHQGDLLRAVPHQVLSSGKILDVYNNIVYNSRKYGAFEVQVYAYVKASPFFKPADTLVRNNTVGTLNTSHAWDAKLIDVYDTFAKVDLVNNLGFELFQANMSPITKLANQMSSPATVLTEKGNIYKNTWQEAVMDLVSFKSKYTGVGAR